MKEIESNTKRTVRCIICSNGDLGLITRSVRFNNKADVYKCNKCGLTFLDQDSFRFPEDFYQKQYHQTYITHIEPDALNPKLYYEKMKKATKIWADRFRGMLSGNETVLDIGCSTGHFMDMVKDRTKNIYGSDLNEKEVEFCRESLGLDASTLPLKERFAQGTFDYITMIYVMEHIADPVAFLKIAKGLLKPNGKMVILVPNAQDALMRLYSIPEFKAFYYCIEHLFYYTPETITKIFTEAGLKGSVETLQEYPIANHLNWAFRRAPSDTLASRSGLPDISIAEDAPSAAWKALWDKFNVMYQDFLKDSGYGDRLWCVVSRE